MQLNLSDKNFCLFLLTQFPFASNDELETMLSDYLFEHFEMPSNEWFDELTGTSETPWNGYTLEHRLNDRVTCFVEFHPSETIWFFNETYLGQTGGHFHLSLLSWTELMAIVQQDETDPSLLFLLLLPLVIGNETEQTDIETNIAGHLGNTSLALDEEQQGMITRFLSRHLIFEESDQNVFELKEPVGLVVNRNHSERNRGNNENEIAAVNEVIKLATA